MAKNIGQSRLSERLVCISNFGFGEQVIASKPTFLRRDRCGA